MTEFRNDMLPDESQTDQVISEDVKPQVLPETVVEDKTVAVAEVPKVVKTPENELLAALKEERNKRKELEQKIKEIELSSALSKLDDDELSEEGRALKQELTSVREELKSFKTTALENDIKSKYPAINDKWEDFDSFRSSYSGTPLDDVAQLFLLKRGLLDAPPVRKGLEKVVGGPKVVESSGLSTDDIDRLMKNEPRKFNKMISQGLIDFPESLK